MVGVKPVSYRTSFEMPAKRLEAVRPPRHDHTGLKKHAHPATRNVAGIAHCLQFWTAASGSTSTSTSSGKMLVGFDPNSAYHST